MERRIYLLAPRVNCLKVGGRAWLPNGRAVQARMVTTLLFANLGCAAPGTAVPSEERAARISAWQLQIREGRRAPPRRFSQRWRGQRNATNTRRSRYIGGSLAVFSASGLAFLAPFFTRSGDHQARS